MKTRRNFLNLFLVAALLASGWMGVFAPARDAAAQPTKDSLVVTSDADDASAHDNMLGDGTCMDNGMRCTLRAAIEEANSSSDSDTITFASAMTIQIDVGEGYLPAISNPVTIDASSVWDTTNNKPGVILNGGGGSFSGLQLFAGGCVIRGLHIDNFGFNGLVISSANNQIGGTTQGHRNVISGNANCGILIFGSTAQYNLVQNNYIGTNPSGTLAHSNESGIMITDHASYNTIGGSTAAEGNLISGNTNYGVVIFGAGSDGNALGGNLIGTTIVGAALPNGAGGVQLTDGAQYNYIGGGGALEANTIRYHTGPGIVVLGANFTNMERNTISDNNFGVYIQDGAENSIIDNTIASNVTDGVRVGGAASLGNWISQNSIYNNLDQGIDLTDGGNSELAAPTITSATIGGASGTACANCIVQIFSDDVDEGETYHGMVNADASGNWSYIGALAGPKITATATNSVLSTSEFSAPYTLGGGGNQAPNAPGCPSPIDNDTQIFINPMVSWCGDDPDGDTVTYKVYGRVQGSSTWIQWCSTTNTYCQLGRLQTFTTYEWQVTADDGNGGVTSGPVWRFTTGDTFSGYAIYLPMTVKK